MTVPIKIELDNLDTALLGFSHAQPQLKKATAPVLGQIARTIRSRARSNVNVSHPRNFFVARGSHGSRLSPSYRTKQEGEFWWVVQTPSGDAGGREAQAEFAAQGASPQGRALVSALTSTYGRPGGSGGGRILYKTRDEIDAEAAAKFESAVLAAAAAIEREVNGG